jgi:hypothetical protein
MLEGHGQHGQVGRPVDPVDPQDLPGVVVEPDRGGLGAPGIAAPDVAAFEVEASVKLEEVAARRAGNVSSMRRTALRIRRFYRRQSKSLDRRPMLTH